MVGFPPKKDEEPKKVKAFFWLLETEGAFRPSVGGHKESQATEIEEENQEETRENHGFTRENSCFPVCFLFFWRVFFYETASSQSARRGSSVLGEGRRQERCGEPRGSNLGCFLEVYLVTLGGVRS